MLKTIEQYLLFWILAIVMPIAAMATDSQSHSVLVSVPPYKYFVEQIAGNTVKVNTLVPAGASFHTFEPTPKQVLEASKADIWFQIGETFEGHVSKAFKSSNPQMQFIDLRKGVELIIVTDHDHGGHGCCHVGSADLHIWLSPKRAKIQAKAIADALKAAYPENKELYEKNFQTFFKVLDNLDQNIHKILEPLKNRVLMVSHAAYAYYVKDYNLQQLAIEFEGRDPTPRQFESTLKKARKANVKTIFVQKQYGMKAAEIVAKEIGAKIVIVDPYAEQYVDMMLEISKQIANQDQ
jgi:zinc transport system substrate-binding protein